MRERVHDNQRYDFEVAQTWTSEVVLVLNMDVKFPGLEAESILFDISYYRKPVKKQPNFAFAAIRNPQLLESLRNRHFGPLQFLGQLLRIKFEDGSSEGFLPRWIV